MKKVVSLILALCIVLSFCACSGSEGDNPKKTNKATITDNEGNTVQLSAKELCKIYDENSINYEAKYLGAAATISGTVESVGSVYGYYYSFDVVKIQLRENWIIEVSELAHPEVVNLSKGQKIEITAPLGWPSKGNVTMDGILDDDDVGYKDVATIQIIE